jgi:hypothetical protein
VDAGLRLFGDVLLSHATGASDTNTVQNVTVGIEEMSFDCFERGLLQSKKVRKNARKCAKRAITDRHFG